MVIVSHLETHLMDLPPCHPGAPAMPRHTTLARVFDFLVKADSVQNNWFLCSLMTAGYPDWDEVFVIPRPEGVDNDIQFFGFYDSSGGKSTDDEECTSSYMQGVMQASLQISGLLRDRCSVEFSPIESPETVKKMREAIRTRKILKSKRAIRWARNARLQLKAADALSRGSFLDEIICKTKIGKDTGPRPRTRAATFLRAVVHARLRASGETLIFD